MQVRVFEAIDMTSGLKMIRQELGPDALILSTRTIRSGKMGLLGKTMLEITAAIDNDFQQEKEPRQEKVVREEPAQMFKSEKEAPRFTHVVDNSVASYLNSGSSKKKASQLDQVSPPHILPDRVDDQHLQNEVNELKNLVKNLAGQITHLNEKERAEKQVQHSSLHVRDTEFIKRLNNNTVHGDYILSMLINQGVNVETAKTILELLRERFSETELSNRDQLKELIQCTIENLIKVTPPVFDSETKQHRIGLLGPTGVGKTTTLAKIAASYLAKKSNSIALITIDTYRIAAVEQLKIYGEIMHLPVEVVITPEQLDKAITKNSDKDLILIDTAGRSPRDNFCIDELATFLRPELDIDKHLVLSATTRETELIEIIKNFNRLTISHTIFTKIDECSKLGVLLNVQAQNSTPLSYLTNGQRVPEDLLEISPKTIAELIMAQNEGSMHD